MDIIMRNHSGKLAFLILLMTGAVFIHSRLTAQEFAKPILYRVPGMERVDVKKNITYRQDGAEEVKMDIYTPPDLSQETRLPAVIFIHGGYLSRDIAVWPKDWGVYISYGQLMAASGLVGVTFNHRYYGWDEKSLETSFADVQAAIAFVRDHAAEYHIDPDRICLWAFSGGGPHLSIALKQKMKYVRCLVSYYAILDMNSAAAIANVPVEKLARYSPVSYLNDQNDFLPPVLIARAGLDSFFINRSIELFVSRYFDFNGDINLLSHPLGRHGFDILDDVERTREIIAATVTFIKDNLNRKAYLNMRTAKIAGQIKASLAEGKIGQARDHVRDLQSDPANRTILELLISESSLYQVGSSLLRSDSRAALAAFQWALELNPASPNVLDGLVDAYEATNQIELAKASAQKVLDQLDKATGLSESQKKAIHDRVTAKLKRLKK